MKGKTLQKADVMSMYNYIDVTVASPFRQKIFAQTCGKQGFLPELNRTNVPHYNRTILFGH